MSRCFFRLITLIFFTLRWDTNLQRTNFIRKFGIQLFRILDVHY
uniref:Uncharacterized protein n=1 Tax=Arundo donax TaxID=35708 RepID=A0A0A9FFU4_ARUDO